MRSARMKTALILSLLVTMFVGCKEHSKNAPLKEGGPNAAKLAKPLIRDISINSDTQRFGIELNGDKAFYRLEAEIPERKEIPYRDGLKLIEGFYGIPGIEEFRGQKSDNRQTSIHYLVNIYDEMPERYSKELVDYVIPKDRVAFHSEIREWFESMQAANKLAEQAAAPNGP